MVKEIKCITHDVQISINFPEFCRRVHFYVLYIKPKV